MSFALKTVAYLLLGLAIANLGIFLFRFRSKLFKETNESKRLSVALGRQSAMFVEGLAAVLIVLFFPHERFPILQWLLILVIALDILRALKKVCYVLLVDEYVPP